MLKIRFFNMVTPAVHGGGNYTAFIDRMKIGNVLRRFFFGVEKAAVLEAGPEGQAGFNQKGPGVLFFDVRGNKRRPMLVKSKLC